MMHIILRLVSLVSSHIKTYTSHDNSGGRGHENSDLM